MGSIFSKALVYLGLVDEDPAELDQRLIEGDAPLARRPDGGRRPAGNHNADRNDSSSDYRRTDPRRDFRRPEERRIEPISRVEGRRVEPPASVANRVTTVRASAEQYSSPVRTVRPIDVQADILVVEEFGDAKILADRVRDRVPVILDLRRTDPDLVRRVIDFASGLIYALEGTMNKVAEGVVAVLPPRVTLNRDERRRLQRLGVYDLADED